MPNGLTGELKAWEERRKTGRGRRVWVSRELGRALTVSVISTLVIFGCKFLGRQTQRRR